MQEVEGTRSSMTQAKEPCSAFVDYEGGEKRRCQRLGVAQSDDEQWWCGLHHPDRIAERKARKAAQQQEEAAKAVKAEAEAIKAEAAQADDDEPEDEGSGHEDPPPDYEALVHELIDAASSAMNALSSVAHMKDTGWPENTAAEKYKVLLNEANRVAFAATEKIRAELAAVKQKLG